MLKTVVFAFIFSLNLFSAEMTLYAIKSPKKLNWKTPRSLLLTTALNFIKIGNGRRVRHEIGHAFLGFKCEGQEEVISGMTGGDNGDSFKNLIKHKHGMSIILEDAPGEFEYTEKAKNAIEDLSKAYRINALKVEISEDQCQQMAQWYEDYSSLPEHIYGGLDKRPLRGEGSGCSAYAMSYFEVADVDFEFFNEEFLKTIYVPKHLLGGYIGNGRKVKALSVLKDRTRLATPNEDALRLEFYDPTDMYYWIQNKWLEFKKTGQASKLDKYSIETSLHRKMKILSLKTKL